MMWQADNGVHVRHLVKPLFGLFRGETGGAKFRKKLYEGVQAARPPKMSELIREASSVVCHEVLETT